MLNNSLYSSSKMDWGTPQALFDKLNNEFDFSLDVCANQQNSKCNNYYTEQDDGLKQSWNGTIWMNPPYGREISKWVAKAYEESRKGCICVCLIPVRSDTKWWHRYVMSSAQIRLLNKRLSFEGANNKAPFPAAIVVFHPQYNKPVLSVLPI